MLTWLGGIGIIRPCLDPSFSKVVAPQPALVAEAGARAPSTKKTAKLKEAERDALASAALKSRRTSSPSFGELDDLLGVLSQLQSRGESMVDSR